MKKLKTFLGSRYSVCELTEIDALVLWAVRRLTKHQRAQIVFRKGCELREQGHRVSTIIHLQCDTSGA